MRGKLVVTVHPANTPFTWSPIPAAASRTVTLPSHLQFRKQSDKNLILQLNEDIQTDERLNPWYNIQTIVRI